MNKNVSSAGKGAGTPYRRVPSQQALIMYRCINQSINQSFICIRPAVHIKK